MNRYSEIIINNIKFLSIMLIVIILGIFGITYALKVSSFNPIGINTTTPDINATIVYEDGTSVINSRKKLLPIDDSIIEASGANIENDRVLKAVFNVTGDSNNPQNSIYDIVLRDVNMECALKNTYFKWALYKDNATVPISEGNFSPTFDAMENDRLVLTNSQLQLTEDTDTYTLLIWISEACTSDDLSSCSSVFDQSNMLGRVFNASIKIEVATGTPKDISRVTSPDATCNSTTLIERIRTLYSDNVSTTPTDTGNGTYYYADSVQLMNDGLDSTGTEITDTTSLVVGTSGNIRYYGAEGDNLNNYIYFNCDTYPETNCETWRIIGIVDGKVKIMRNEPIGDFPLDYTSTGEFDNNWNDATVMTLLNDSYYYSKDNVSYYICLYNEDTRKCDITPRIINFGNPGEREVKGITEVTRAKDLIDIAASWYINGISDSMSDIYPKSMYKEERTGTSTWPGGIALAYPSDYGYTADLRTCKEELFNYHTSTCTSVNWMKNVITNNENNWAWLITPWQSYPGIGTLMSPNGYINRERVTARNGVTPTLYLDPNIMLSDVGNGSSGNPYRIDV